MELKFNLSVFVADYFKVLDLFLFIYSKKNKIDRLIFKLKLKRNSELYFIFNFYVIILIFFFKI
jgi:hypothetical protein